MTLMINPRIAEAMAGIGTILVLFLSILMSIFSAQSFKDRAAAARAARLKELKKYSIPPLGLR